jgi:hypothetical protein
MGLAEEMRVSDFNDFMESRIRIKDEMERRTSPRSY